MQLSSRSVYGAFWLQWCQSALPCLRSTNCLINEGVKAFVQLDGVCVVQRPPLRGYSVRIKEDRRPGGLSMGLQWKVDRGLR